MMACRLLVLVLAGAMLALTPAAHASPPDQSWIAGLYDDADYDDAVLAVLACTVSLDPQPSHDPRAGQSVRALVLPIDESLHLIATRFVTQTRAPPIA